MFANMADNITYDHIAVGQHSCILGAVDDLLNSHIAHYGVI